MALRPGQEPGIASLTGPRLQRMSLMIERALVHAGAARVRKISTRTDFVRDAEFGEAAGRATMSSENSLQDLRE